MKAALYARVSTKNGQNPDMQLEQLRDYCKRRGISIEREYVDFGVSGTKESRPQLDLLMSDARRRLFDLVLVWKFDRFARSVRHMVLALDEFNSCGIGFVSLTEALDTTSPMGRAMFAVIAAMAQLERDLIAERVKAGIEHHRKSGKHWGRKRLEVEIGEHKGSIRQLAAQLGVSRETIRRRLTAQS